MKRIRRYASGLPGLLLLAACSGSDPLGPEGEEEGTLSVHADPEWTFVRFEGETASSVSIANPSSSEGWDIAFRGTAVMLNGGGAGPGEVEGHCLCQNDGASASLIMEMTALTELADFESVTAAQIPEEGSAWTTDALDPAIEGWYSYSPVTHVVSAAADKVWYLRPASGTEIAKVHVTLIENPTQGHAGLVSVEYALQTSGGTGFGAPQTVLLDLTTGAKYLDLESGSVSSSSSEGWDLFLDGYTFRVNGGVSGSGNAAAVATTQTFSQIDGSSLPPAVAYSTDAYGGVFSGHPWYRYNLSGEDHLIWPTFDVYLVRKGDLVYKVQLINYYNDEGDPRWITFRYELLQ